MISSATPHQRMIIGTLLAGAALLAALWVLAISPKRSESAEVHTNVAAQQQRLAAANTELASYQSSRKQYPGMLAELKRLSKAVPARGAIPALLAQLQHRARVRGSDLQVVQLNPSGSTSTGPTGLTPGATMQAGGLATLPFTFTYTGRYFDLVHVLAAARRAVTAKSGDLKVDGRLVTIEGLSFQRLSQTSKLVSASVSGTAYIAAMPATPTATQGGS